MPKTVEVFPLVEYSLEGTAIMSNAQKILDEVKERSKAEIERPLVTPDDFAAKEDTIKAVKITREELKKTLISVERQFVSLSEFNGLAAQIDTFLLRIESDGKKKVDAEKARLKQEMKDNGTNRLDKYIEEVTFLIKPMPYSSVFGFMQPNFELAIKGKRSPEAIQEAIYDVVSEMTHDIHFRLEVVLANITHLEEHASDYGDLFPDKATIISKDSEAFALLVKDRIREFKDAEKLRQEKEMEAGRLKKEKEEAAELAEIEDITSPDDVSEGAETVSSEIQDPVNTQPAPSSQSYTYPPAFITGMKEWRTSYGISQEAIVALDALIKKTLV